MQIASRPGLSAAIAACRRCGRRAAGAAGEPPSLPPGRAGGPDRRLNWDGRVRGRPGMGRGAGRARDGHRRGHRSRRYEDDDGAGDRQAPAPGEAQRRPPGRLLASRPVPPRGAAGVPGWTGLLIRAGLPGRTDCGLRPGGHGRAPHRRYLARAGHPARYPNGLPGNERGVHKPSMICD
jgi:hypothetical protein